ncbi:hypothetical protein Tco_0895654 [Tanacetum coccineum]|uniref:CCHC-type domain-containing protein n=1 Tax=Tanacetum coccineum TaxID=301880 RepID=A0ABQ5CGQ5_9ASTR
MPVTRQGDTTIMTSETVQAMIDQALQKNSTNTHDDGSQNSGGGPERPVQPARVCSYTDFMKCQPLNFKGIEGVVGLSQWFKKMESVFHISGCAIDNQVKFITRTLLGAALTWWNGHVKGNDVGGYTQRFQEFALMCTKFLFDETEKVDKYINVLPDNIHGNVMQAENKRKLDNNNQAQQQLLKKQNAVQAYTIGSGEKKPYGGSKPLCPKCNYHHDGECAPNCTNCKKVGHLTKDCWHPINANNQRTITCYEYGNQRHYRSDCPVLKNQGTEARGMVYALGGGETDQDH